MNIDLYTFSPARRPGWTYERAGVASMVYPARQHRRARMLRMAENYFSA